MILCVAGNPSIDKLFEVEEVIVGAIHRPERFVSLPGGKGIHVAQVATALGADAVVTGILAGHAGRWIMDALTADGVRCAFAWGRGETRSSLSVADTRTGQLTEFYESGAPVSPEEWRALAEQVDSLLPRAGWIALAGSLPPDALGYTSLIAAARGRGVRSAVDSRGEALREAVAAGAELVKINVHEAAELLGRPVGDAAEVRAAALEIRDRAGGGGHAVVITRAEDGMVMIDPDGHAWQGGLAARGRYPVGSGDSFLAGLLVGLQRGERWPQAAALALGAAAANAEMPGAGHLDPARAVQLARRACIKRLR